MLVRSGTYWRMLAFSFPHLSFIGKLQWFYRVLSLENSPWAGLGMLARQRKNTDVHKLSETAKNTFTFGDNKDVNSSIKFIRQFFCASLGRSLCHGNEHHGIDPNILSSGHHDCSTKAVFLCTAVKLQSWPMLSHWTQHTSPSPPFNQHSFEQ